MGSKKQVSKPAKKTVKKIAKKLAKKPIKKKGRVRKSSTATNLQRYNAIRNAVAGYLRGQGLPSDKGSVREAMVVIYPSTKDQPLKQVIDNIDIIYQTAVGGGIVSTLPEEFPFWDFNTMMSLPEFDGIVVSYSFSADGLDFSFEGNPMDAVTEFRSSGLYRYLRQNYNGSPPNGAVFRLAKTDGKKYAKYKVVAGSSMLGGEETAAEAIGKPSVSVSPPFGGGVSSEAQTIAIEREKQKTEKERQKTLREIQKLMKMGWTKKEIMKLLK
jgi:hypothetical protein